MRKGVNSNGKNVEGFGNTRALLSRRNSMCEQWQRFCWQHRIEQQYELQQQHGNQRQCRFNDTYSGEQKNEVKNEKLIVYTNSNSDGRGEWWTEQAKQAGFESKSWVLAARI